MFPNIGPSRLVPQLYCERRWYVQCRFSRAKTIPPWNVGIDCLGWLHSARSRVAYCNHDWCHRSAQGAMHVRQHLSITRAFAEIVKKFGSNSRPSWSKWASLNTTVFIAKIRPRFQPEFLHRLCKARMMPHMALCVDWVTSVVVALSQSSWIQPSKTVNVNRSGRG
jgi:hypothetical protein